MLKPALALAAKDLKLAALRGSGLVQALLLGLLIIFVFSLARRPGEVVSPDLAAVVFAAASLFTAVLVFNAVHALEEPNLTRMGLLLSPVPTQAVWLGKALAGLALLAAAQLVFGVAAIAFLDQTLKGPLSVGLAGLLLFDLALALTGSLLGALAQGHAAKESLLSVVIFPLLTPPLLAAVRLFALALGGPDAPPEPWIGLIAAYDAVFAGAGLILFPFAYSGDQ